jgi:hypothetical protein
MWGEEEGKFLVWVASAQNTSGHIRVEVFTTVTMKNGVFWDVTSQRASVANDSLVLFLCKI